LLRRRLGRREEEHLDVVSTATSLNRHKPSVAAPSRGQETTHGQVGINHVGQIEGAVAIRDSVETRTTHSQLGPDGRWQIAQGFHFLKSVTPPLYCRWYAFSACRCRYGYGH
jgi:hypothetical protein